MSNKKQCEIKDIKIDGLNLTIPKDGALDFGGIGKGYLIDQLSSIMIKDGYRDFWISLGGDIVCSGFDLDNKRWKINIANANNNDENATSIFSKEDGSILAIATSGITKRKGEGWHHIIDPRINQSADTDLLTATVLADSATKADVYAKNLIIVGSQESLALAKKDNLKIWLQKNNNKCIEYLQYNWSPNA
jgi:thiamine biosynthesis lipoprotein